MEEYLRRVQSRLGEGEASVHAVLGGPEPDVDTIAATLCLALHISQKEPSDRVCVPVLSTRRCDAELPQETVRYLQRLKICEGSLLWKEDVDLIELHRAGRLALTILRDGLLDSSEYHTLESSIQRVVHHDRRQDAEDDGASTVLTTVTRELLQEAAEHIGKVLGESLGEALQLQSDTEWSKYGRRSGQLQELLESLEGRSGVTAGQHIEANLEDLEQLLTVGLKEFSDGEMTIALTSVTSDKEDWHDYVEELKLFSEKHNYDGLVVLLSITDKLHHPRQQVAVFSKNTDILNQICGELEESSSWSLSGEMEARGNLQVYHIPLNTPLSFGSPPSLVEEMQDVLKVFIDRRSTIFTCHPSSRTSSTEGVAGSVEFSQGSSGINDMDSSDIEQPEGGSGDMVELARVTADVEDGGVGVSAVAELVSPDSGMTTIRSSRSSKESSVFLSDDSPVGDVTKGGSATRPGGPYLRNPSPMVLSSLSLSIPPERRKHRCNRNKSDNFDLLNLDPLQCNDNSNPTEKECTSPKTRGDGKTKRAESSSFSELEELNLLDFSGFNSLGRLESSNSSVDHHGHIHGNDMIDTMVPPTPVNSVVGSRPPSSCGVRFFPEDVLERISGLQHKDSVSSSLSENWDELGFDTQGASSSSDNNAWNRPTDSESPQNIMEEIKGNKMSTDVTERRTPKTLQPQLSLVTEQSESYNNLNLDSILKDHWNPVTLAYLQLTPPEEEKTGKVKDKTSKLSKKKATINILTPDTSKEEDEGLQGRKGDRQMELLDFWTYSAQKGFLKSDSGTTTSYPESLDMWNMTIREDSLSPLTTPENLSEASGSFCGVNPSVGGDTPVESPLGFTDSGMMMWNTTIQEDSSSTVTSPDGPEIEKDLSQLGSLDTSDSSETRERKQMEEEKTTEEENITYKVFGNAHNVKIVIEEVEGRTRGEETDFDDVRYIQSQKTALEDSTSKHSEDYCGADIEMTVPVAGMVTSISEYDNVGAGGWSLTSSPETYASPVIDMIQREEQSSPFVHVTPIQIDDYLGEINYRSEQQVSQMFRFDDNSELGHRSGGSAVDSKYENDSGDRSEEEADWIEKPSEHSPFVLVDFRTISQDTSTKYHSSALEVAATQIQTDQSPCIDLSKWDNIVSKKYDGPESTSSLHNLWNAKTNKEDRCVSELQGNPSGESIGIAQGEETETMSLTSGLWGEQDTLKYSCDSLHPGSQDDLRSNSDGDSSGLEMEYIIVSGTVKEAEREWSNRPKQGNRPSKGTENSMETLNTLSKASTVLQTRAQAAQREQGDTEIVTGDHMLAEIMTPKQSDNKCSQSQVQQEIYDDKSNIVSDCVSPSLRYPSDHFLKTREEVYVHSQISMEDSDDGGQSPSAPPTCPTSFGDLNSWGGQLERKDTPQTTPEPQSPLFTHSSVSHSSSLTGTPLSESGISSDRGIGLPFSGDLMDEENDEGEQEEDNNTEQNTLYSEKVERQHLGSSQLAEEPDGYSSFQQTDLQNTTNYSNEHPERTVHDHDKWSTGQQIRDYEASQDTYSNVPRQQEVPSQFSSQPTTENTASQWTGSHSGKPCQTQYGYNYHYIDQRTENQVANQACVDSKPNSQANSMDVYAEFTTNASAMQCGPEQAESYYESGVSADYRMDDQGSRYMAEGHYGDGSNSMYTSKLQCSQDQPESNHTHCQFARHLSRSGIHSESGDHAQYVHREYVHFHLERQSHQEEATSGRMMMKMVSCEDVAKELDKREDSSSSADLSSGSSQKRQLSASPVSLDHSEGSLLSEDALDTEDDALDTGDDLDVSIDEQDTPEAAEMHGDSEESNQGIGAVAGGAIAVEESRDGRMWRSMWIGEQEHRIDMRCIEPYKRVISHGGYYAEQNAIIVFAACFLPDSNCDNYNYVMENLFLYVINTLELMVAEDYIIVYLNGVTPRRRMPGLAWMKKCYQMIDRRLKKNLKMFIIVHPSWFIRTLLGITRPFISSKFSSKIKYVNSLQELGEIIPMEYVNIPPSIVKYDEEREVACMRLDTELQ